MAPPYLYVNIYNGNQNILITKAQEIISGIMDGFKGEYNIKIDIDKNFPDELRGKPIQINVTLNKEYFDRFPGYISDLIPSYHNYNVEIPSIYIAVPFNKGVFKDKVLYTSCQAGNLNIQFDIGVDWKIEGIKYISRDFR